MANINDSFLVNLSQSLGISYDMKKNVLGNDGSPNSAIFNINQIASIMAYGKPIFGVYENPNSFATMEFINNGVQIEFRFSPGIVFYQRNLVNIPSQSIDAQSDTDYQGKKLFKFYLDYKDFNLASTVFTAEITNINSNIISVNQLPPTEYLNNFKTISINNYLFGIVSINSNTNTVVLNQDVSSYASIGYTCTLIFQPLIKYTTTFAALGSPPDIEIPSTGIILASAEVIITGVVGSLSYSCPLGVEQLYESYPIYDSPVSFFPNIQAYNAFLTTVNNTIKAYSTIQSYTYENNLLNSFITYTAGITSSSQTFDSYWHSQPFKPTSIFQYGLGFQGLQKTDFDERFKNFYFFAKNLDLTRTLAIFRGDIYGGNAYVGQSLGLFPGSLSISNYVDFTGSSTITNGSYSYGISAVSPDGEYAPKFNTASNFYFNKKVNNYISYTSQTEISNLLFFHVYKTIQEQNGYQQQRLTTPFELTQYTLSDNLLTNISTTQGIASSNFAIQITSNGVSSGVIGGIAFNAYITDSTALTGIQSCIIKSSGSNYIQPYAVISGNGYGAAISLSTTAGGGINSAYVTALGSGYTQTPTITIFDYQTNSNGAGAEITPIVSQLQCGIYTGNASNPIGAPIANLKSLPISSISSSYIMNMPIDGANFIGLSSNTYHWAVFSMNTPYTLNSNQKLKFMNSSGFSTSFATTNDYITWQTSTTNAQVAKLGYNDQGSTGNLTSSRGVYLTNYQSAYPTRLQLYVPNLDLSSLNFDDVGVSAFTSNGTVISTSPIQNSLLVYVLAQNSLTGYQTTLVGSVPKGTQRGTSVLLGNALDLFDKVLDVLIVPDLQEGVTYVSGTTLIDWSIYDTITVDTVP